MLVASWWQSTLLLIVLIRKPPQQSFTEREFQLYEEETGLKRRNKLISHAMNSKYKFYVIPYVHDEEELKSG